MNFVKRVSDGGVHYYVFDNGAKFIGVTSILKMLPLPPALAKWKDEHVGDYSFAFIGTLVHYRIANYYAQRYNLPPVALEVNAYHSQLTPGLTKTVAAMFQQFLEFDKVYALKPLAIETTVFHTEMGYAGTVDIIGTMGDGRWLVDWKTTRKHKPDRKPYENYEAQCWAYREAIYHMNKIKGVDNMAIVYLAPDGYVVAESHGDEARFREALALYRQAHKI